MKFQFFLNFSTRLILLLILLTSYCSPTNKKIQPKVVKGVLDLSNWDFDKDGVINLDGDWEFYWEEFIDPNISSLQSQQTQTKYIPVPSQWQKSGYKTFGFGTYRLKIQMPSNVGINPNISLLVNGISSSYEVFVHGEKLLESGRVGKERNESDPYFRANEIELNTQSKNELEIIIHVSNFYEASSSGIFGKIQLGFGKEIKESQTSKSRVSFVISSILFSLGFYHIILYLNRRKDFSPMYFGIFCLLISVRELSATCRVILDVFPELPFWIVHKLEFIPFYLGSIFFVLFIRSLFPIEFSKKILLIMIGLAIPPTLLLLFAPMNIYSHTRLFFQILTLVNSVYLIYIVIRGIINKRLGSRLIIIGVTIVLSSAAYDILMANGFFIHSRSVVPYGLLVFVFIQAVALSRRLTYAFTESEKLALELKEFSLKLESKVEERTIHLENAKLEMQTLLENTEKSRAEMEASNELIRNINSVSTLTDVMSFVMYYLETDFGFKDFWLILPDKTKNEFYTNSFVSNTLGDEIANQMKEWKSRIDDSSGSIFESYVKQEYQFKLINKELDNINPVEKGIIQNTKWNYFFYLPLLVYGETIGILCINKKLESNQFSDQELDKLQKFSDQIAGAVFNAGLLKETEIAKFTADTERDKSEKLLLNILPEDIALELKEKGSTEPMLYESVSVLFTDFKGFTLIAEKLSPADLVRELDSCFIQFDKITERFNLEKLKTIGDSYMCAGGIPKKNKTHHIDSVLAALEIQAFMNQMKEIKEMLGLPYWELRLGVHTGPLIAGVIGEKKFAYDVWGDTVNTASRMESSGTPGKINISGTTYHKVKEFFDCEFRGQINAKNKGLIDMYYVIGIKNEYTKEGNLLNEKFWQEYKMLKES